MTAPATTEDEAPPRGLDRRLARRLLQAARPYRALAVGALLLLVLEGALQLVGPLLTRRAIDVAFPARDAGLLGTLAALYALSLVLQFACAYGETLLTGALGQRVMRDLRVRVFAHVQRLPVPYFDRTPVGRLTTRVTADVEALNELFTAGVVAGIGDLFALVAIAGLMLWADWKLALAAFVVIPFVWLASHLFQKRVRVAYREIRARLARINAFLQERVAGMRVVQLFGQETREARRFERLNGEHLDAHMRSIAYYALYFPVIELLTTIALASLIVGGASRVAAGTVTVGTVAAFLQLVRRFFQPLQDLSDKYNTLQQALAAAERIYAVLDTPVEEDRASSAGDGAGRPRGVTVEFDRVWFTYDGGATEPVWALEDVSFAVRPGETLALVGHTGAGKSTITALLMRFYVPQRGRILLDGIDLRELSGDEVRRRVGYVQQDIFLFAGDVATNIRLANPLSDDEVALAAARVGADSVVRRLPRGYAQPLGERGASVSVGERQLLSFARAVAADPDLLLLDEATSAVDSAREAEIQRALGVLMAGRTTIAVAHRLSTIVGADEILVLHHGRVVERGTHRGLLRRGGQYARLWRLQVGDEDGRARLASPVGEA